MNMAQYTIRDCNTVLLPKISNPRGNLTFLEGGKQIPFEIKRIFYIYDVPTEEGRGAHSHRSLWQGLISLSGSFDVALDDGTAKTTVHLNRPWKCLLVPPMIWAAEINFDPGTVCLVLASEAFSEADYIRNYDDYLATRQA